MRSVLRAIRYCVLPQSAIMLVCILLCIGAISMPPSVKPSLAMASARSVIQPANQIAERPAPKITFVKPVAIVQPDCSMQPCIALSFDDGPNRATTSQILSILEQEHIKASFFIVGNRVAGNEDLLRRMQTDGFEIGNHSWSHPDFTKLSDAELMQQIAWTQGAIEAAGVPAPTLFRPPYGALNLSQRPKIGLQIAMWNEDPRDWAAASSAQIIPAVLDSAKPGGVVDMHDIYQTTADSLTPIIQALKDRHYNFVTVSELMKSRDRPTGEPFYGYHYDELPAPTQPPATAPPAQVAGVSTQSPRQVSPPEDVPPQQMPSF